MYQSDSLSKKKERKKNDEFRREKNHVEVMKNSRNKYLRRTVTYVIHLFNMHGYNNPKQLRFLYCKLKKKEINRN